MSITTKLDTLDKRLLVKERQTNVASHVTVVVTERQHDGSLLYMLERGNGREWVPEDEFNAYRKKYMSEHGGNFTIFTPNRMT